MLAAEHRRKTPREVARPWKTTPGPSAKEAEPAAGGVTHGEGGSVVVTGLDAFISYAQTVTSGAEVVA